MGIRNQLLGMTFLFAVAGCSSIETETNADQKETKQEDPPSVVTKQEEEKGPPTDSYVKTDNSFEGIGYIMERERESKEKKQQETTDLIDAPLIAQMPELPRGCEVATLAMMLGQARIEVSKMTLAEEVRKDPTPYSKKNGQVYFGNPNTGFVGNMYTFDKPGYGVYNGPIADLAREYLGERVINLSGNNFDAVLNQVDKGKPVWVVNTSLFKRLPESYWRTWNTPTGKVKITYKMHSVLITGYDEDYIYFNDALANQKNRKSSRNNFVAGWEQFGKQAVSYN
ncbi:C39 family peptidase [Aquibacillus sp. 3ASR75-11]|uniref:C39 family peptidase n=1 Tax=Terrihalobacillus insolitus TaxID=2950438 RepID=A0A9X3WVN2_9BACI|nr:C39 family peptidase [Terrihalobacillus insolitus]MDC3425061.1 C39 family peptidase [Terrihalobacillus insolitus]